MSRNLRCASSTSIDSFKSCTSQQSRIYQQKPKAGLLTLPQELQDIIFKLAYSPAPYEETFNYITKEAWDYRENIPEEAWHRQLRQKGVRTLFNGYGSQLYGNMNTPTVFRFLVCKKFFVEASKAFISSRTISIQPQWYEYTISAELNVLKGVAAAFATRVDAWMDAFNDVPAPPNLKYLRLNATAIMANWARIYGKETYFSPYGGGTFEKMKGLRKFDMYVCGDSVGRFSSPHGSKTYDSPWTQWTPEEKTRFTEEFEEFTSTTMTSVTAPKEVATRAQPPLGELAPIPLYEGSEVFYGSFRKGWC